MRVAKTITERLVAAREKEEAGQWSEAAGMYQKIVDEDPTNEAAIKKLLMMYRKQKELKKELAAINEVLKTYEQQSKSLQESWLKAHPKAARAGRSILQQLGGVGSSSFGVKPIVVTLLKRKETLSYKLSGKKKKKQKSQPEEPVLVPVKELRKPMKELQKPVKKKAIQPSKELPPAKKILLPKKASPQTEAPSRPSLFIINLTYLVTIDKIDAAMQGHLAFLDKYYKKRQFLVSGRKVPRTGGIIIARAKDRKQLEQIVKQDPFIRKKLASAEIIEFSASQAGKEIASWLA